MKDNNWDLINGPEAHEIDFLNYSSQINVIEAALKLLQNHQTTGKRVLCPNNRVLLELHRCVTLFLLESPGEYRENYEVVVQNADGSVRYEAPPSAHVPDLMRDFETALLAGWEEMDAIDAASFALWKINWVHPFRNGNGRSARGFAYLCLCHKLGFWLPGAPTVLDLIMLHRPRYDAALAEADAAFATIGAADLTEMRKFLTEMVMTQLASAQTDPAAS